MKKDSLEKLLIAESKNKNVSELKVLVETGSGESFSFQQEGAKSTHFIASSTKMMAAAMVFKLVEQGKLQLQDKILDALDNGTTNILLGLVERDWLDAITIDDLLRHKSGFLDYRVPGELMKMPDVERAMKQHPGWTFEEIAQMTLSKGKAKNQSSKANYSGLNYQLIGKIIENVSGTSRALAFKELITKPLGLTSTYLFDQESVNEFDKHSQLLVGERLYLGAKRMASLGYEGAVVSSLTDTMRFLRGYFKGEIFSLGMLSAAQDNSLSLFPGVIMGAGIMTLRLPLIKGVSLKLPTLIGHAGMTGHQMFYLPGHDVYVVLTPNQIGDPTLGAKVLAKVLGKVL